MITRVLVANRGEIARRVFATCRRSGLGTVAVHTDADAGAPHVREADARVRLSGTMGYLDAGQLVDAARAAGADAVHPGYGFLSENADFAAAVQAAGLHWIGPEPAAIASMGSKIEAKKLMAAAGVPVLGDLDPDAVTERELPVLIKASAGGGGRGMRVVRALADLPGELAAARREAQSAFGDPTVFCERYLAGGHHVEVQVLADAHGTVWALGERECSIQRRHQKVVEETPSPLVARTPGMRERLLDAARLAATAIGYTGAGTVEFIAPGGPEGDFFFLEMNTRLQVEHPVTEEVTGVDLVALQLEIADGGRLPADPPPPRGHAIEARLCAEDPAGDWQPQAGPVHLIEIPGARTGFQTLGGPGVRLDSGVEAGSSVSMHYDSMLAKVIAWAPTRERATAILADALARARLHGVQTNRDLLVNILRHPDFGAGATDTTFLDRHGLAVLSEPLAGPAAVDLSALAAALADAAANRAGAAAFPAAASGFRNLASGYQTKRYGTPDDGECEVAYRLGRDGTLQLRPGGPAEADGAVTLGAAGPDRVELLAGGVARSFQVTRYGDVVFVDSPLGSVRLRALPRFPDPDAAVAPGSLLAPMPGTVTRIGAQIGAPVTAGTPLLWLEAMKMEHTITAPADGVLTELPVTTGQQVDLGTVLARVEAITDPTGADPGSTAAANPHRGEPS